MDDNLALRLLEEHHDFTGAPSPVDVEGMSSPRLCAFLNRLVASLDPSEAYLEIGTWRGRTLLSAAYGNSGRTCIGCDKFRLWGRFTGFGFAARRALFRNIERHRSRSADILFYAMDAARFFAARLVPKPIGVYFYDGDHSFGGTFDGLVRGAPYLAERSVLLVDDWNDRTIRRATFEALEMARLRVLWRRDLPGDHGVHGFWNGVGAFWLEKRRDALRAFA